MQNTTTATKTTYWNISDRYGDWDGPATVEDYEEISRQLTDTAESLPSTFEADGEEIREYFPSKQDLTDALAEYDMIPEEDMDARIWNRAGTWEVVAEAGLPEFEDGNNQEWIDAVQPEIHKALGLKDARNQTDTDLSWELEADFGDPTMSWWDGTGYETLWAEMKAYGFFDIPDGMTPKKAVFALNSISGIDEVELSNNGILVDIGSMYSDNNKDVQNISDIIDFWDDAADQLGNDAENIYRAIVDAGFEFV